MSKKPNFIYIGPTVARLGLKKNTVYRTEKPPAALEQFSVTKPFVLALYIPVSALAETRQRLTKKGSLEYTATQELLAIAQQGN